MIEAGANAIVAGSAVFGAKDYAEGMTYKIYTYIYIERNKEDEKKEKLLVFVHAQFIFLQP